MKKSKSSLLSSGDRLSELPDSLIYDIFWLLPITDVVKTTILSKRWRDLWKTSPFLNFSSFRGEGLLGGVEDLFNRALLLWRGTKLQKFMVNLTCELTVKLVCDINVWLQFAKDKQVEELYLDVPYDGNNVWAKFDCVFSCSSLKVLSIEGWPFEIHGNGNVKLDRLESLKIDCDYLLHDEVAKVLCGSPNLEVLKLVFLERDENVCIESSILKKLSIEKYLDEFEGATSKFSELKIQTPNLEMLEIWGVPYSRFSLNALSLIDVTLQFCDGGKDMDNSADVLDKFLEDMLKQILPAMKNVERFTLTDWCLEVLLNMDMGMSLLSPLSNVKFLKVNANISAPMLIANFLEFFPKLKRLVIEDVYEGVVLSEDENEDEYQDENKSLEFEANISSSFLLQLRTVEVISLKGGKYIFPLVEMLLKYAIKLEKMVFHVCETVPPSSPSPLLLASQILLGMPRSSPTAKLICCEYIDMDSA